MKRILLLAALLAPSIALAADTITLKMGDNQPDRTNTWGAVIETINAEFKAANPGVDIVTESYPDQPYQEKIKIYATAKQLPDVFKYWSFSTLLKPMVDNKFVVPLDRARFEKLGYMAGALDSDTYGGKLYGIPVSAVIVDSPWATCYSSFVFDPQRYPDPKALVDEPDQVQVSAGARIEGAIGKMVRAR